MSTNIWKDIATSKQDAVYAATICTALIVSVCLQLGHNYAQMVSIFLGCIMALIIVFVPPLEIFQDRLWGGIHLISIYYPIVVIDFIYSMDLYIVKKSIYQIFMLGYIAPVMYSWTMGTLLYIFLKKKGNLLKTFLGAILMTGVEVQSRATNRIQYLDILMKFETVLGMDLTFLTFALFDGAFHKNIVYTYQFIGMSIRYGIPPFIIGPLIGKFASIFIKYLSGDVISLIAYIIGVVYLTFFFCAYFWYTGAVLTIIIVMLFINSERSFLSTKEDQIVIYFFNRLHSIVNLLITFPCTTVIMYLTLHNFRFEYVVIILSAYIIGNVVRFVLLGLITLLINKVGYGFNKSFLFTMACSSQKSGLHLLNMTYFFTDNKLKTFSIELFTVVPFNIILTNLINSTIMELIMNRFGLTDLSSTRKHNITNSMMYLENKRIRLTSAMKIDRNFSDCNWQVLHAATAFNIMFIQDFVDDRGSDKTLTFCHACNKIVHFEPTPEELAEMTKELKHRILRSIKISFTRQHEKGMIDKDSFRGLIQAVEIAMDSDSADIKIEEIITALQLRQASSKVTKFLNAMEDDSIIILPHNKYKRAIFKLVTTRWYDIMSHVVIMIDVLSHILILSITSQFYFLLGLLFFYILYVSEFLAKLIANSDQSYRQGMKIYLRNKWNKVGFSLIVIESIAWLITLPIHSAVYQLNCNYSKNDFALHYILCLRFLRIFVLLRLVTLFYPSIVLYFDKKVDVKLTIAYVTGKALIVGYEEVIDLLPQMSDNAQIQATMQTKIDMDRLALTRELGRLQKHRPLISVSVNTRQAALIALLQMKLAIEDLKSAGQLDNFEYNMLQTILNVRLMSVENLEALTNLSPKDILYEIAWIGNDQLIFDYLYENVTIKIWDAGDIICKQGETIDGIYILVSGVFKMTYVPNEEYLLNLTTFGILPVKDHLSNTRFSEVQEEYILKGNSFGELAVLTGRPYSCTIVSDTPSQAFIIPLKIMKDAFELSKDPVYGLRCRLWKHVTIHMARRVLQDTAIYSAASFEQMNQILDRALTPNLCAYKQISIPDTIDDVVIVEGYVVDYNTREIFTAPCFIPRNVKNFLLPIAGNLNLQELISKEVRVILMVFPMKDVDEYDALVQMQTISELIDDFPPTCVISAQMQKQHKKRKRLIINSKRALQSSTLLDTGSMTSKISTNSSKSKSSFEKSNQSFGSSNEFAKKSTYSTN